MREDVYCPLFNECYLGKILGYVGGWIRSTYHLLVCIVRDGTPSDPYVRARRISRLGERERERGSCERLTDQKTHTLLCSWHTLLFSAGDGSSFQKKREGILQNSRCSDETQVPDVLASICY